ncbi:MAG: TrkA family potassium uptake protein [Chloroflexi bacterium]|nr:TrkA family potassium uptake protein [Chloroflexota bacterium]
MNIIIMGCGRVGAQLAEMLDAEGHHVTVVDTDPYSFRRLPHSFSGSAELGNGMDQDFLRHAGIEQADVFVAATQGDNRNIMAAQIAKHIFKIPKVICRIYDPIREEVYRTLGLQTISPTTVGARMMKEAIERQG